MTKAALALPLDEAADTEAQRLDALDRYDILDTPREEAFERIASLVQTIFGVDTSVVAMIDGHRQWYKAKRGLDIDEAPMADTFCKTTMQQDSMLVVEDAAADARFKDNPFVTGPSKVRFYAGTPLKTPDGHTVGTLCALDTRPRAFPERDRQILGQLAQIAVSELELRHLATTDGLTGVVTRRAFRDEGARMIANARRHKRTLSAIAFDLDHFKSVNDTYGHATGDDVLKAVTQAALPMMRQGDLFGRLGGEEFALLLPDADAHAATAVAERIRVAFRALTFPGSTPPIHVSASFGIAALDAKTDDLDGLLAKADESLGEAKREGRNRSVTWGGAGDAAAKPAIRRRVLKAGRLLYNNRRAGADCTVRSLSDTGAAVDVSATLGIPNEVTLAIRSDGAEWPATVVKRTDRTLELRFAQPGSTSPR